jgi:hypothetical protein
LPQLYTTTGYGFAPVAATIRLIIELLEYEKDTTGVMMRAYDFPAKVTTEGKIESELFGALVSRKDLKGAELHFHKLLNTNRTTLAHQQANQLVFTGKDGKNS